jgi:deoxyribose-phosphate aldolase
MPFDDSWRVILAVTITNCGLIESGNMQNSVIALIDHAVLAPTASDSDVRLACEKCRELGVASVCVKPCHVELAAEFLENSPVLVSTVIGFPHGGSLTEAKMAETRFACRVGAREVDMVVNLGMVLAGDWDFVAKDIRSVVATAREHGAITKVIFETGLLPSDEIKTRLCQISEESGAAFVKTSTGFGYVKNERGQLIATGATEQDVALMRKSCGPNVGIKASGGIRTLADARRFVALGATRLGTSSTEAIAAEERAETRPLPIP